MLSLKKGIFLETIITCEEASLNLLKSCLSFGGGLEGSNEKKLGGNRKERFYSEILEMLFDGGL